MSALWSCSCWNARCWSLVRVEIEGTVEAPSLDWGRRPNASTRMGSFIPLVHYVCDLSKAALNDMVIVEALPCSHRCGPTLRYAHQACGGGRVYAATAILGFMRFTTRTVFAPVGTHLYLPPRASKAAPRGQRLRARRVSRPLRRRRAPKARYARRSPAADGGLRGSGGEAPPDRCAYGFIERGGPCHRRSQAAPSRAGPRLNGGPNYVRPATGQRRITACVMRSFTPSHGPRRRGPRLGVHTLPFQAHPRAGTEAFCSLGAAWPRLRFR